MATISPYLTKKPPLPVDVSLPVVEFPVHFVTSAIKSALAQNMLLAHTGRHLPTPSRDE